MGHFIRCDRCEKQDVVMGTLSLPPGWQNVLHADLCEPCCQVVREFIRFKVSDAANLPVEPIEEPASTAPVGDKLFEIAPEVPPVSGDSHEASAEATPAEKQRTRKAKKLQGQDAILPDPRKSEQPAPQPGAPA